MHGSLPATSPPDPAGALKAARAARRAGDHAGAADLLAAYLAARPEDIAVRVEHGWACWATGDRDEATAAWHAAAALDPQAVPPRMALLHAARAAGDSAGALALVDAVLADHPSLARAWVERAVLLREGGDPAQAEAAARQALDHAPGDPRAWVELARALRRRGATQDALAAFAEARAAAPQPPGILLEEARTLLTARHFDAALACLVEAQAARPDDATIIALRAQALRRLGRRAEALAISAAAPGALAAAQAWIDRAALARPARLGTAHPPGAAEDGTGLAAALAGASAREVEVALHDATREAHPFTAIGAARALRQATGDPALRASAALAEAHALGALNMQRSAMAVLGSLAAEALPLPAPLAARLATQRAHTALRLGRRDQAETLFEDAQRHAPAAPAAMLDLLRAHPADPPPATCLALLEPGRADPRLRAWLADRVADRIDPTDSRLSLAGLHGEDPVVAEALLRRNVALARGQAHEAARLFDTAFTHQGLAAPQPTGAPGRFAAPAGPPADGPLVSIIISAFDAADTLADALSSVLAQSWRSIEAIVVDDASTDGTAALAEAMAARDSRVRVLRNARNAGTYASRNRAIAAARGEFVTFVDADDWMHPARIATEVAAFADPRIAVVNSCWFRMDASGRAAFAPRAWLVYPNPSFAMIRRDVLRRLGAYDHVRFSADSEMLWRARLMLGTDAVAVLPQTLTIGLHRPGSLTTTAATGFDAFGYSAPRLDYNEGWGAWHAACDRAGAVPFPPAAASRTLPEGMAAGEAG
jgi:tetratricopeptide (TPR) repeat protein